MAKKYLDDSGLSYLWGKLKDYFQVKLVSGTNIKTVNNNSLLGNGNITISGGGGTDYITEEGTDGIWTYRKWNSGIAECWGTSNQTNVAATTKWPNASMYYGILTNVSFPSGLFTSTATSCHLFGRITGGNGWLTQNTNMSSSTVGQVYVITPASITLTNVNINIYATGRWK